MTVGWGFVGKKKRKGAAWIYHSSVVCGSCVHRGELEVTGSCTGGATRRLRCVFCGDPSRRQGAKDITAHSRRHGPPVLPTLSALGGGS